jgi:hypothetical protein
VLAFASEPLSICCTCICTCTSTFSLSLDFCAFVVVNANLCLLPTERVVVDPSDADGHVYYVERAVLFGHMAPPQLSEDFARVEGENDWITDGKLPTRCKRRNSMFGDSVNQKKNAHPSRSTPTRGRSTLQNRAADLRTDIRHLFRIKKKKT